MRGDLLRAVFFFTLLCSSFVAGQSAPLLEVQPGTAHPGDLVMITLRWEGPCPTAFLADRPLAFFTVPDGCRAFIGLTTEQPPGPLEIKVVRPTEAADAGAQPLVPPEVVGTLDVLPPAFNVRELTVSKKFIEPSAAQKKQQKADQRAFAKAFAQRFSPPLFTADFARPTQSEITAPFGDLRTFNGKKQSQHYGMDLDGNTGDPIRASNSGVVVMARENFGAGNTVIVHHGGGLFTSYFHLSRMDVKQGQKVKQNELLGLIGKSGRVTGPHLHFGCKVHGLWVDPASLLELKL